MGASFLTGNVINKKQRKTRFLLCWIEMRDIGMNSWIFIYTLIDTDIVVDIDISVCVYTCAYIS